MARHAVIVVRVTTGTGIAKRKFAVHVNCPRLKRVRDRFANLAHIDGNFEGDVDAAERIDQGLETCHVDTDIELNRHPDDLFDGVPKCLDTGVRVRLQVRVELGWSIP